MSKITKFVGLYLIAVGLIAFAGNMLGLSITPFIPGTNVNERPWVLYILLFPYYFLQETFTLAFGVTVTEGSPWTSMLILNVIDYVPAVILILLGWWMYRRSWEGD